MASSIANIAMAEPIHLNEKLDEKVDRASSLESSEVHTNRGKPVFEDYLHFAALQRLEEDGGLEKVSTEMNWFQKLSEHKGKNVNVDVRNVKPIPMTADEEERANASRALRLASWASVFYLITTDILGPFNAPFAISTVGWVPGVVLYFVMGVMALYTGLILWRLFIRLDSGRHPVKTYADISERIFGRAARHIVNVLQSLQLIINVATICLSNGQALSQLSNFKLCFSVCIVIFPIVGFIIGQIRTLKNYGWLANGAVWLNLLIIFTSMGFVAHSAPNFAAAKTSLGVDPGPVVTLTFTHLPLFTKVNGIMNMVFAYGGAMIFPEMVGFLSCHVIVLFLAHQRFTDGGDETPNGLLERNDHGASAYFCRLSPYGVFVYAFQGQFTLPLAFQGVSKHSWQDLGNVLSLITGIIAAGLYGNIGIMIGVSLEVVYINIVEDWLKGPRLMTAKGRAIWTVLVLVTGLSHSSSALPSLKSDDHWCHRRHRHYAVTYSFPPLLRLGYDVITDAMGKMLSMFRELEPRVASTLERMVAMEEGSIRGPRVVQAFNLVIFLGGMAMACLGMWGAGEQIKATFALSGAATSFGCKSPLEG
ncbi:transmembrane amino acid transporter protein-domain-containing protein [Flammula alnicola]|nr:transmembrane amino acid transporter protein-domain-containing protein [Flammula alnicola]